MGNCVEYVSDAFGKYELTEGKKNGHLVYKKGDTYFLYRNGEGRWMVGSDLSEEQVR